MHALFSSLTGIVLFLPLLRWWSSRRLFVYTTPQQGRRFFTQTLTEKNTKRVSPAKEHCDIRKQPHVAPKVTTKQKELRVFTDEELLQRNAQVEKAEGDKEATMQMINVQKSV